MPGFSELIGSLEKTRDYFRDFFVYGFKTNEEFTQRSKRTYEDEKRRAELLLKDHIVSNKAFDSPQKKVVAVPVDSSNILENPFYGIYFVKSFTDNDIKLHFAILDILGGGERLTAKEMTDRIYSGYSEHLWRSGDAVGEGAVRGKLNEYADEGLLMTEKEKNRLRYYIGGETVKDFLSRFEGLTDAVKFFSETQEFGIVGNIMLKAAGLKNDLFYMKHSYIIHTLEDEVISVIAEAVENRSPVTFVSEGSGKAPKNGDKQTVCEVIPFMILVSAQTGRRYLMSYDEKKRRFLSYRLDQMKKVRAAGRTVGNYDELLKKARKALGKTFGVSFGSGQTRGIKPVRVKLFADEVNESYIVDRIMREKRCGTVERTDVNEYTLTFDIFDPGEILGWLKTFIGRIISIEGGTEEARERLLSDVRRMKEMYGGEKG